MRIIERGARRTLNVIDSLTTRLYGWPWNPAHQSGAAAVAMLLVLIATGLYLVVFYRVGSPSASVARLAGDPWLGAWMRSLHRYASDVFLIAGALHLLRMFAQGRSWGPRTLAWVSGLTLFGAGLVCAWTGFVMAWDTFGERLARDGARMLDVLPVFSEPLGRIFAGDGPVPSAFFFVNLFIHIAVPLAMGALLWLHVSRLARPTLLPPRRVTWTLIGALTVAAVLAPAALGPPADAFRIARQTPVDVVAAWWLPLSERLATPVVWGIGLLLCGAPLVVPRFARRPREGRLAPSVVDPRLCTGCNQCAADCPWEAITMVRRDDGRDTLLAQIDPARCVSCGICAGSCAPMGVGPPGRNGRDQLTLLRTELLPEIAAAKGTPVVTVCCENAPAPHLTALRDSGARVYTVSCVGNLHSSVMEHIIRAGARGVLVCGCPPRDCRAREGPKWLHERLFAAREAELHERVDRRRVRTATLAAGDLAGSVAALEAFVRDLALLEEPRADKGVQPEPTCDPVPFDEVA